MQHEKRKVTKIQCVQLTTKIFYRILIEMLEIANLTINSGIFGYKFRNGQLHMITEYYKSHGEADIVKNVLYHDYNDHELKFKRLLNVEF